MHQLVDFNDTNPFPVYVPSGKLVRVQDDFSLVNFYTFAEEALSVGGTSTGFTPATFLSGSYPQLAVVSVEVAPVRVRFVGTPTTTVGRLYPIGSVFEVWGERDIKAFKAISQSGATATLWVDYARPQVTV